MEKVLQIAMAGGSTGDIDGRARVFTDQGCSIICRWSAGVVPKRLPLDCDAVLVFADYSGEGSGRGPLSTLNKLANERGIPLAVCPLEPERLERALEHLHRRINASVGSRTPRSREKVPDASLSLIPPLPLSAAPEEPIPVLDVAPPAPPESPPPRALPPRKAAAIAQKQIIEQAIDIATKLYAQTPWLSVAEYLTAMDSALAEHGVTGSDFTVKLAKTEAWKRLGLCHVPPNRSGLLNRGVVIEEYVAGCRKYGFQPRQLEECPEGRRMVLLKSRARRAPSGDFEHRAQLARKAAPPPEVVPDACPSLVGKRLDEVLQDLFAWMRSRNMKVLHIERDEAGNLKVLWEEKEPGEEKCN